MPARRQQSCPGAPKWLVALLQNRKGHSLQAHCWGATFILACNRCGAYMAGTPRACLLLEKCPG
eukprot:9973263-Lingulodinium_polyedra.AAC.1